MVGQWVDLAVLILGAIGGTGGIISIYHAKSKKDAIDIQNFHELIEEERKERALLSEEYRQYKNEVNAKVEQVKKDFEELRSENQRMLRAIYQAYRCRFPEDIDDCPVISMFNHNGSTCKTCRSQIQQHEEN